MLDIAPTLAMYEQTTEAFARAYWHWFFLILPAPRPREDDRRPTRCSSCARRWRRERGLQPFAPEALAEYERCFTPEMIHASCEDYRAAAVIDLEHDRADREAGRKIALPAARALGRATAWWKAASTRWTNGAAWHKMCAAARCLRATTFPRRFPSEVAERIREVLQMTNGEGA